MNSRTDFADEILNNSSKEFKKTIKKYDNMSMTTIDILNDSNPFNKEKGRYISIDFDSLYDETIRDKIMDLLINSLNKLYKIKKNDKVLIVGLGNDKIVSDSLGPMVADKIVVTNHLFSIYPEKINKQLKKVCVFTPKVMGQTGLESADLVLAVNKLFKPNVIIVIDALASLSIHRINRVIQLSDTGISPGSGVGNYRKEINEKSMNVKVIALGVATVVEAKQIIQELNKTITIPEKEAYNLILTPKEIDEDIEHLSNIIACSLNKYIHYNFKKM